MSNELAVQPQGPLSLDPRRAAIMADPMEPQSLEALARFAEEVSKTDFAASFKGKPVDCFIAMRYGRDLGLSSLQSVQGIAVINGKPSVYGDTFWALILSHPDFEDVQEEVTIDGARVVLSRRGRTPKVGDFSQEDAKTAKLWGKMGGQNGDKPTPWVTDPKSMLLWRARHRASSIFADALRGILPREVAMDFIEGEVVTTPRREPIPFASPAAGTKAETKSTAVETKPVEDVKASTAPATITPAQAKEFNDARKASGYTVAEATAYQKDVHGISRSGEMLANRFEEAMTWAKTPKEKEESQPVQGDDQKDCLRFWDELGTNQEDREAEVKLFTSKEGSTIRWDELATALHARLEDSRTS